MRSGRCLLGDLARMSDFFSFVEDLIAKDSRVGPNLAELFCAAFFFRYNVCGMQRAAEVHETAQ